MNLTEVFSQDGKKEEVQVTFPFQSFAGEQIQNTPVVNLTLANIGKGKVCIDGTSHLEFLLPCDRCLQPVVVQVPLEFSREVLEPEQITDEEIKEEQQFVEEYDLNLEALLKEELQLSWPSKVLCKEECKGICKKCGQNLNEESCDCDDFVPDIRFANLMDIFNGSQ